MSEINHFPSATHDGPSHTPYPSEIWRTVFGEEHPFQSLPLPPPPPPPPPHEDYTGVPNSLQTLTHQGQRSWDSAVMPESQRSTVPRLNMEFSSEEEAYGCYKKYAEQHGFKVRKGKVQRTLDGKVPHTSDGKAPINKRIFLCSKEGKRSKKVSEKTPKYERKETRTSCKAEIRIELKNGKWVIYSCSLDHNHALERPGQTHETDICPDNSQVVARESTGDSAHVVDKEGGTAENRSPEEIRVSNYLPDKNVAKLPPEDVQSLLNFFSHLQAEDPSFFYAIQLNLENQMTSFFWRDGRSRIDYDYFGDMLVLDTCRYQMDNNVICAPFFGVNHHKDLVLFGCAFLLDETEVSFRWLFRTFLEAMGYSQPKILYTALSEVIASAAEKQFPETKHRILWRFISESGRKLFPDSRFHDAFWGCIYDSESEQDFEKEWKILMEDFELQEDPWLATLYKSREKWSALFSKVPTDFESFLEFGNLFYVFPSWTPEIATLSNVLEKYLERVQQLRLKELKSDSLTMPRQWRVGMEEHAEGVYTPEVFADFEFEFKWIMSLAMEEVSPGPTCVFKLKDIDNDCEKEVIFDCSNSTVSCSCKKFEREGILCSHSLKVLNAKNIFRIPEQYVLKRWTRSAKQGVEVKGNSARDNMDGKSRRLHSRNLMYKALNVITKSVATEKTRAIVERHLDLALRETEKSLETEFRETDSRGDDENNDEICCGERHCPIGKRKKIESASSSDNDVHGS